MIFSSCDDHLVLGRDSPDSCLAHRDVGESARDALPLGPDGVCCLGSQPPPNSVLLIHGPAYTSGTHTDSLHAPVYFGPLLAPGLGRAENPEEDLVSRVDSPDSLAAHRDLPHLPARDVGPDRARLWAVSPDHIHVQLDSPHPAPADIQAPELGLSLRQPVRRLWISQLAQEVDKVC